MATPTELRARATELENRVPPVTAGPRTDDERMWLEKAAALREEADHLESESQGAATAVADGLFQRLGLPSDTREK